MPHFSYCTKLTEVSIGENVATIGSQAFLSCRSLATVTISSSVTSIGRQAFYDCENLTSAIFENTSGWKAGTTSVNT